MQKKNQITGLKKELEDFLEGVGLGGYGSFAERQYDQKINRLLGIFQAIEAASPNPEFIQRQFMDVIAILYSHKSLAERIHNSHIGYLDKD